MLNRRTLSRSLEVHVYFNARTRVDTVPERRPALDCAGNPKIENDLPSSIRLHWTVYS
jgi:hypothetical protein